MQIKSNRCLLNLISNHEIGIRYPDLIPYIACNIVIQRDDSIFAPTCYRRFSNWFLWMESKEGHDYWCEVNKTLHPVNNEDA